LSNIESNYCDIVVYQNLYLLNNFVFASLLLALIYLYALFKLYHFTSRGQIPPWWFIALFELSIMDTSPTGQFAYRLLIMPTRLPE